MRSAPAPRAGEPGSGTAAPPSDATCPTSPPALISQRCEPIVTTPVGGYAVSAGALSNVLPPLLDTSVSPLPVRTMIVSPAAETRVTSTPCRATGLHHASDARADDVPMRNTTIPTDDDAVNLIARRR